MKVLIIHLLRFRSIAAGYSRHYGNMVTVFYRRVYVAYKTDVLVVEVKINKSPDLAVVITDSLFNPLIICLKIFDNFFNILSFHLYLISALGERPERRWNTHTY